MNYQFLRTVIGGTWHVNAQTYFELMPVRNLILTGMQFENAEPDASSLPYFVNAENYYRYPLETTPESGQYVFVTVVTGAMTRHNQACGGIGTNQQMAVMEKYDQLPSIVGHILYLDSGGGQTISLDPFKEAFAEIKKPVLAYVENMAASAAMGAASFADEIYASKPKAVLGSIGTMIAFDGHPANTTSPDGIHHVRLYASRSVKKNGDFEAALKGDYKPIIENTLNPVNNDFIALIQANRPAITDEYCDGQDYYAEDVIGTLIDGIMPFDKVVSRVIELSSKANTNNANNTDNTNNTPQNNSMTTQGKLNALAALIGLQSLESQTDGSVNLNSEAVDKILSNLIGSNQATDNSQALTTAQETIAQRDLTITSLNSTISTLKSASKVVEEQATTITDLKAKVVKLEAAPGANTAQAITSSDDPESGDPTAFMENEDLTTEQALQIFAKYSQ